ncbi:5392_t:CDS:1, partial [Entrophospora sp. SA101]
MPSITATTTTISAGNGNNNAIFTLKMKGAALSSIISSKLSDLKSDFNIDTHCIDDISTTKNTYLNDLEPWTNSILHT